MASPDSLSYPDYSQYDDTHLLALCCYREARSEGNIGRRGVMWVVHNRAANPGWWGHDIRSVILKPWQFSSFNENDPNHLVLPVAGNPVYDNMVVLATDVISGADSDVTNGATYYHDTSMGWPTAWGNQSEYMLTLSVGRLLFYRPLPR